VAQARHIDLTYDTLTRHCYYFRRPWKRVFVRILHFCTPCMCSDDAHCHDACQQSSTRCSHSSAVPQTVSQCTLLPSIHTGDKHCVITAVLFRAAQYVKSKSDIAVCLNYLTATWNHMLYRITQCYLPPDSAGWLSQLNTSQGWYSIYLPQRDARLSWPGWW